MCAKSHFRRYAGFLALFCRCGFSAKSCFNVVKEGDETWKSYLEEQRASVLWPLFQSCAEEVPMEPARLVYEVVLVDRQREVRRYGPYLFWDQAACAAEHLENQTPRTAEVRIEESVT